ncbi:MAG: bifunctional oligoribonuclease/PAP phosphatase NrnA [bacterium]
MQELLKIKEQLEKAKNVLIVTHNDPDPDALASSCIIIDLLESMNKNYLAYCYSRAPESYLFLPHVEKIRYDRDWDFSKFDTIVSLDCGSIGRTCLDEEIKNRRPDQTYIEIDHHPKIDDYADIEVRDPAAAATTEILYSFLKINNILINEKTANCILAGIIADTGNFIYPSTSRATITIASEMLSCGARLPQIVDQTWRNKSLASMKLWGLAMSRLQINFNTNIAWTVLTLEDYKRFGANDNDIEGVAGFMGNLPNVKAVMMLRESEPGVIKGSLRTSHPDVDVSKLARMFGGGGHEKASGFGIKGSLKFVNNRWKIVN